MQYISVKKTDITVLEVSDNFDLENASQDDLRSLLTSSIPIKEIDDYPLEIKNDTCTRFFNADNL
jgi:hypothetical protein